MDGAKEYKILKYIKGFNSIDPLSRKRERVGVRVYTKAESLTKATNQSTNHLLHPTQQRNNLLQKNSPIFKFIFTKCEDSVHDSFNKIGFISV
jgi:hypothetical protein